MLRISTRGLCAAVMVAGLGAAPPVSAQDIALEFPTSLKRAELTEWMKRNTDLEPASVIAVTPDVITGILSSISTPEGPTIRQVNLRSEVISREAFEQQNALSWTSVIEVDCKSRKARLGRTMVFSERNLIGEGRQTVAASRAWIPPIVGGPAHSIMLKICDGKTVNPLTGEGVGIAARAPSTSARSNARSVPQKTPAPRTAAPSARSGKPGPVVVQIAAADSEASARRALSTAQARQAPPAGVSTRVQRAVVGGKTYFRAQFAGFASRAEAQAFCDSAAPGGCLIRGAGR